MKEKLQDIKATAANALSGNYTSAATVVAVLIFSSLIPVFLFEIMFKLYIKTPYESMFISMIITSITMAIAAFFIAPLLQGVIRWYFYLLKGDKLEIREVFYYYSDFSLLYKTASFMIYLCVYVFATGILVGISAAAVGYIIESKPSFIPDIIYDLVPLNSLYVIAIVLAVIFVFIKAMRYFFAPIVYIYLLKAEGSDNGVVSETDSLEVAELLYNGRMTDYIKFIVSNIGLILLTLLGVTAFFSLPRLIMRYVAFARLGIEEYMQKTVYKFFEKS